MTSLPISVLGFVAIALGVSGCAVMQTSQFEATPGVACQSNVGAYSLPRRLVNVVITKGADPSGYGIEVTQGKYVPDREGTYCLDYLVSYLGQDRIGIERTESGLLQRVFTKTIDNSDEILQRVVQAGADLAASNIAGLDDRASFQDFLDGSKEGRVVLRKFEYDPFDQLQSTDVNNALRDFGYCLSLDHRNDRFVPDWAPSQCGAVKTASTDQYARKGGRSGLSTLKPGPVDKTWQQKGILYRPELSHSLVIRRKDRFGIRGSPWHRVGSEALTMPNAAPAFILEIKRAAFVEAETDVAFNQGMIQIVKVKKPSELLVVSNLTVSAVQVVLNIPRQALNIFNTRERNIRALIAVNQQLITTLEQYDEALERESIPRDQRDVPGQTVILTDRSGTVGSAQRGSAIAECVATGIQLIDCQEIVDAGQ